MKIKRKIFHYNVMQILLFDTDIIGNGPEPISGCYLICTRLHLKIRNNNWECIILFSLIILVPSPTSDLCSGCSICLPEKSQGLYNNLNPIKASQWDFSGASACYTWVTFTINNDPFGARFSTLIRKHFCYSPSGKLFAVSTVYPFFCLGLQWLWNMDSCHQQ